MKFSLRSKILLTIIAVVVAIAALGTWGVNDLIMDGAQREAESQAQAHLAQALYDQHAATLAAEGRAVSLYPAVIDAVRKINADPLLRWSKEVSAQQGKSVTVTDADGKVIARGHAPERVGDDLAGRLEGLRLALWGQETSGTEAGDELDLALRGYAPVLYEGEVVGAVMLAEPVESLEALISGPLTERGTKIEIQAGITAGDERCDTSLVTTATCYRFLLSPDGRTTATMKPSQNSLFKADTRVRSVAENGILGLVHVTFSAFAGN